MFLVSFYFSLLLYHKYWGSDFVDEILWVGDYDVVIAVENSFVFLSQLTRPVFVPDDTYVQLTSYAGECKLLVLG